MSSVSASPPPTGQIVAKEGGKVKLCDLRQDGEVWVDGALLAKDGQFLIYC